MHGYLAQPRPIAIAHRGGSLEGEENTLANFARAVALGYGHVETDVHLSADGEVVIHHDPTLSRMTGDPRAIAGLSWAELSQVRTHGGAPIPRLDDLLEELRRWIDELRPKVPPSTPLGKAIRYVEGRWLSLCVFVLDGRIPMDLSLIHISEPTRPY